MKDGSLEEQLRKYRTGKLTPEETAELEKWIDTLAAEPDEEQIVFNSTDQNRLLARIKVKMNTADKSNRNTSRWLKIAASLALLAVAGWFLIAKYFNPVIDINDHLAEASKILLQDGTIVWYEKDTKVSYVESPDGRQRLASLEGEALFEVAKDPSRPFIISCGNVSVRVVGTSFSLRSVNDSLTLTVLTGKVNVSSSLDSAGVNVLPSQTVLYAGARLVWIDSLPKEKLPAIIKRSEYNMAFNGAGLGKVFERVSAKFAVRISLRDPAIADCIVTGDYTDQSLTQTLDLITHVHGLKYTREGPDIVISGAGCPP